MIHNDDRFAEAVEQAVQRLEERTDAEVVVVSARRSGEYRDLAYLGASLGALAFLAVLLFAPIVVSPPAVLVETAVTWVLLAWLLSSNRVLRWLAPRDRRRRQARQAADAEFHHEAVHGTPRRTGILVYVSALEGEVVLVADAGIEALVPPGRWKAAREAFAHDDLDHFLQGLDAVGEILAEHVPPGEGRRVDLPDAPRVRG